MLTTLVLVVDVAVIIGCLWLLTKVLKNSHHEG